MKTVLSRPTNGRGAVACRATASKANKGMHSKALPAAAASPLMMFSQMARAEELEETLSAVTSSVASTAAEVDLTAAEGLGLDPVLIGGGVGLLAIGGAIFALARGGGGSSAKIDGTTAAQAYKALGAEERAVLVDVRMKSECKADGVPQLKETGKKLYSLPFAVVRGSAH